MSVGQVFGSGLAGWSWLRVSQWGCSQMSGCSHGKGWRWPLKDCRFEKRQKKSTGRALFDCLVCPRSLPLLFHLLFLKTITAGLWPEYYYPHFTDKGPDQGRAGYLPTEPGVQQGLPGIKVCRDANFSGCPPPDGMAFEGKTDSVKDLNFLIFWIQDGKP